MYICVYVCVCMYVCVCVYVCMCVGQGWREYLGLYTSPATSRLSLSSSCCVDSRLDCVSRLGFRFRFRVIRVRVRVRVRVGVKIRMTVGTV